MGKRLEVDGQDVISTDDQTGDIQASFDSVDTARAVVNDNEVYVQDTRPSGLSSGDVWLGPSIVPAVGTPLAHYPLNGGNGADIVDAAGHQDGLLNTATWTSGSWVGGHAVTVGSTGDYVELTTLPGLGPSLSGPVTMAYTIETTDSGSAMGAFNSTGAGFVNEIATLGAPSGSPTLFVRDTSNNVSQVYASSAAVDDGSPHRVVWSYSDVTTPGSWTLAIDGSSVSTTVDDNAGPSSFEELTVPVTLFGSNDDGTQDRPIVGTLDNIQVSLESWSTGDIEADYQRQPWV